MTIASLYRYGKSQKSRLILLYKQLRKQIIGRGWHSVGGSYAKKVEP